MKTRKVRPPVKTHGGKWYLTDFIISHFPPGHEEMTYCEPFCAGASVFLNKVPSRSEVINDVDRGVISIFKALRDEPNEFIALLGELDYDEDTFLAARERAADSFDDYVERAVNEYVLRRMSRGGMKRAFAWSKRLRGNQPGDRNAWETMLGELPRISERLQGVVVLNLDYAEVFRVWDEENTLTYFDPPYMHITRSATDVYEHEMTADDHMALLHFARNARGKIIISGYSCPMYNQGLKGWRCKKKNVANHSSQSATKERRLECLWMNY